MVSAADAESVVTSGISANANAITNATTAAMACRAKLHAPGWKLDREPNCERREGTQAEEVERMNIYTTVRLLPNITSTASLRFYDGCRSYPLADVRRNCATSATVGDVPERHMFASFYVIPCFSGYHRTASHVKSGTLAFLSMLSLNSNKVHQ